MAVAEVDRRIRAQTVEVTLAVDIGDPRPLGGRSGDRDRRVVVRHMRFGVERETCGRCHIVGDECVGHGVVPPQFQCAAFDPAAALQQLGEIDGHRPEPGLAQLGLKLRCAVGHHDVQSVGDQVEAEYGRVGVGGDDGVGEQLVDQAA